MKLRHKNKTLTSLLAFTLGGAGLHRFYLHGIRDFWGWAHLLTLPLSMLAVSLNPDKQPFFLYAPLILSIMAAFIETLVLGLIPDEKWDATYNPASGKQSRSAWPLAVLLVLTVGVGAVFFLSVLARTIDLYLTGGAQG
jgi:hypothetical protein